MDLAEFIYHAKKAYSIYPGVLHPVSGRFLHDHYVRRATVRGSVRLLLDALVGLGFHAWIPWRARRVQRRFGLDDAWRSRAERIAHARFADPNDIALFRIERAEELDGYIRRFEDAALNRIINAPGWTSGCVLADKVAFYRRCVAAGLPHPQVVATLSGNRVELISAPGDWPLLLKPARGEGGRGVAFLPSASAMAGDPDALTAWLSTVVPGRGGVWIVQRRLAAHANIVPLALHALTTARITTILNERGDPEPVSAVLRFASDPVAQVDNMKAGGLLAPIDIASGALGLGCKGYGGGDYERHPVTGASIAGFLLPDWQEAKALAVRAHHEAFGEYAMVGWDIGLSDVGPMLVEGNSKPGVLMPQRAGRAGLGGQRYGELLALQLARKAAT
ncbi:MAG TPA: sugar-transfer associated ATP-grasp domain-containing protein [Sphingomonas sp.]|nr:sugar-transfer associated ATP-grasp domain-containing protein [Sphingomonas sp.]